LENFIARLQFYDILINCGLKAAYPLLDALSHSITRMIFQGFVPALSAEALFMAAYFAPGSP